MLRSPNTLVLSAFCAVMSLLFSPAEARAQIAMSEINTGPVPAADKDLGLAEAFRQYFDQRAEEGFSGEIKLIVEGNTVFHRSYGVSGCSGAAIVNGGTYLIGSLVKDYTRLAAFALAGQGDISLHSPITDHLPGLPAEFRQITVRMLIDHTSGLPDVIDANSQPIEYETEWDYERVGRAEMLRRASGTTLLFAPGSDEHYSNLGYTLLAMIIEEVSSTSYERFLREQVFEPLGMANTGYLLADTRDLQQIDGCNSGVTWSLPSAGSEWMEDGPSWNLRGNGGMVGTVADIEHWLDVFAGDPAIAGDRTAEFLQDSIGTSRRFGSSAVGAGGSNGIYNAYYLKLFEPEITLIMLSNNSQHLVEDYKDDLFNMLESRP